jgi:PII-like signaling protein
VEPNVEEILKLKSPKVELQSTCCKPSLSDIIDADRDKAINEVGLFLAYFNDIPNIIQEVFIDINKAHNWLITENKSEIRDVFINMRYFNASNKCPQYNTMYYILFNDLLVYFDAKYDLVRFLFRSTDYSKVETVMRGIKGFKIRKDKSTPQISLLVRSGSGLSLKVCDITKPQLSLYTNYNDDFKEIHHIILKRLSKINDKGLVLLHGKPGTGKTSYIRYLVSRMKKQVIFLPPNMAQDLSNPELISVLIYNPNSILVIEDAENIVIDREQNGHSPVSTLLNISDGLLSDFLNIQLICTFNTDLSKVDSALLRKGRLIAKYEFKELEIRKAQALCQKLGFNSKLTEPMTLSAIYNQEEKDFQQLDKRQSIGYKISEVNYA